MKEMGKRNVVLDRFLKDKTQQDIVRLVYDSVMKADSGLSVDIKWRRLTFAVKGDFHHWICAVDVLKDSVALVFHYGGLLEDRFRVFKSGASIFLRKIEFKDIAGVNDKCNADYVKQAIAKRDYFIANWKELNKKAKA